MKIKKLISCAFIASFLILMFNGLLDLSYGIKKQYIRIAAEKEEEQKQLNVLPNGINKDEYIHHIRDTKLILTKYRHIPLIGHIQTQGNYGIYTIGKDGNRLYSEQSQIDSKSNKRLLIIGNSQSFGYLNDEHNDLVGQLSKLIPQYHIDNFSVPGQTLRENLYLFKYLISIGKKYDLVYVINGPMDIFDACLKADVSKPPSPPISFDIGITKLINKLIKAVMNLSMTEKNPMDMNVDMCNSKPFDNLLIDDMIVSVNQILDYGNNQERIKTIFIIPPTPYTLSEKPNTQNLVQDQTFVSLKPILGTLIDQFARGASPIPGVYDLTHSFDESQSELFIDTGAHLTPQGNKILAQAIKELTVSQTD